MQPNHYQSRTRPTLRWRALGILVIAISLGLGAWVKVLWSYWLVELYLPGKQLYNVHQLGNTADSLNRALGSTPILPTQEGMGGL